MRLPIACEGAPRDLGLDQGRACKSILRARFSDRPPAERMRLRVSRPEVAASRIARDVARHFPRHAEAFDGLARGAGVPRGWLAELLARAVTDPGAGFALPAFGATGPLVGDGPLLARGLPADWVLRRASPEGGFRALELTPVWFAGALAGVSEAGLAATVVQTAGAREGRDCAAPAALLVQDCLHRFESLDGALDWCLGRPVGGCAEILLADAEGEVASVSIAPGGRRVHRPADGLAAASLDRDAAKALRQAAPLHADRLARVLGTSLVALDPVRRRVGIADPDSAPDWARL